MASTNNNIGIMDPEGINPNPLTGEPFSPEYKNLAKSWSQLPAYKHINEIIKMLNDNQVILISTSTGSGKTVLVPKILLHIYNYDAKIGITLPKQLIAKSAATYAAATLDVPLGGHSPIGYKYKGSPKDSNSEMTKLLYASDGTIVQALLKDPLLKKYDSVVIDELHEHKIQIDMLLYLLRQVLHTRPSFKLVLMSATVDKDMFKNYFKDFRFNYMEIKEPRNYKIETIFSPKTLDYDATLKECFKTLIHILETDDVTDTRHAHDIIIFVTASSDAFKLCKQLNDYQENEKGKQCKITCDNKKIYCVEVYSGMDHKKEELATDINLYQQQGNYNRKVVIGTNVAESSLTIDGLRFVINCCYEYSSSFDPINSARKLDRELIAHSSAIQREGRAGRTEPGVCYHLCSETDFNHRMLKYPLPDILTSDITMECLQLLATPLVTDTKKLLEIMTQFVASPKQAYLEYSLSILMQIGAIENEVLTPLGKLLINVPCNNLFMSLAILYGKIYDCSIEMLQIASLIEVCKANINDLFNSPNARDFTKEGLAKMKKFENVKKQMANKYGDHLTLLFIYDEYIINKKDPKTLDKYCRDHFLKSNLLAKADNNFRTTKHQLHTSLSVDNLKELDIKLFPEVNKMILEDRIMFCLLAGLRLNTAVNKKGTEFYRANLSNLDKIKLHKNSFLNYDKKKPSNVMYYELFISMGRSELSIVSVIPEHIVKIVS